MIGMRDASVTREMMCTSLSVVVSPLMSVVMSELGPR